MSDDPNENGGWLPGLTFVADAPNGRFVAVPGADGVMRWQSVALPVGGPCVALATWPSGPASPVASLPAPECAVRVEGMPYDYAMYSAGSILLTATALDEGRAINIGYTDDVPPSVRDAFVASIVRQEGACGPSKRERAAFGEPAPISEPSPTTGEHLGRLAAILGMQAAEVDGDIRAAPKAVIAGKVEPREAADGVRRVIETKTGWAGQGNVTVTVNGDGSAVAAYDRSRHAAEAARRERERMVERDMASIHAGVVEATATAHKGMTPRMVTGPAPVPPTDEEIVAAMQADRVLLGEGQARIAHSEGYVCEVRGVRIYAAAARAAWSRILAAKVRASDAAHKERERWSNAVQLDDADDAGAADA